MEGLYEASTGLSASKLNCWELQLEPADIDRLEKAVTDGTLPQGGGSSSSSLNWSTGPIPGRILLYGENGSKYYGVRLGIDFTAKPFQIRSHCSKGLVHLSLEHYRIQVDFWVSF